MRRTLSLLAMTAIVALAPTASAEGQPSPDAERHFMEGKRLRDEGRCAEAVIELDASVAIEPSIGAHYNLGFCNDRLGRGREALTHYDEALALADARGDERASQIRAQREEFLEKTPHLRLALPSPLPRGLRVTVDGEAIPAADLQVETWFFPSRADDGCCEIVATAPGFEQTTVVVDAEALARREPVTITLHEPKPRGFTSITSLVPKPSDWTTQHWGGAGLGAAGVVALGVALYVGIDYLGDRGDVDRRLDEDACLDASRRFKALASCAEGTPGRKSALDAIEDNNDLVKRGRVFGIGAAVGGALLVAGGAAMFLTAPPKAGREAAGLRIAPVFGRETGGALVGTF